MAISEGKGLSVADLNTIINNVQNTYKKYGFSDTASTVSADTVTSAATINAAINKLNAAINDSTDRRFYYYKGSALSTISVGSLLSAEYMTKISTTNTSVANDYCNCDSNCRCDSNCCNSDCCDWGDCSCDKDCCDSNCCQVDCTCQTDCACNTDCCNCDACSINGGTCSDCCNVDCSCYIDCACHNDCCDCNCCVYDSCTEGCGSDCCDNNCSCDSN